MVSFYWFDYETFGTHPAFDRPCQFAGVRTDPDLNIIGEPLILYCRQAADYLPHPAACQVTGISPQLANDQGIPEAEFIQRIVEQIGRPGTCSVGYNSIRFDDEFTRHTLFRNLHDPYEHEWKDGNSRWDLIDVVRLTRALRPEGIHWPFNDDGSPSNRLEHLSVANGIEHGQAHDALSDVLATIGMARLIRDRQPRLYEYVFKHRDKASISSLLNTRQRQPVLQVSGMISGTRNNLAAIIPLIKHPQNANGMIVLDLQQDPRALLDLDADEIARRLYQNKAEHSPDDPPRPGLRTVHVNKCPVIVPFQTLRPQDAERTHMDREQLLQHARWAEALFDERVLGRITQAMSRQWPDDALTEVDGSLYSGAFLSPADKQRLQAIRALPVARLGTEIGSHTGHFEDRRLDEMVWRYQARNYPDTLDGEQLQRWREHCRDRLKDCSGAWLCLSEFERELAETSWRAEEADLKRSLQAYARQLIDRAKR